ncbi:hypothetical protein [Pseudoalteromonas xiamenensis]
MPVLSVHSSFGVLYHLQSKYLELELFNFIGALFSLLMLVVFYFCYKSRVSIELVAFIFAFRYFLAGAFLFFYSVDIRVNWKTLRFLCRKVFEAKGYMGSNLITKTEPLVERNILVAFGEGYLSIFYLVQQVFTFITQLVNRAYTSTRVPDISTAWVKRVRGAQERTINTVRNTFLMLLVLSMMSIFFIYLISSFEFGKFSSDDMVLLLVVYIILISQLLFSLPRDFLYSILLARGMQLKVIEIELSIFFIFNLAKLAFLWFQNIYIFVGFLSIQSLLKFLLTFKFFYRGKVL